MSFDFQDAKPVKLTGVGRNKLDNPFYDMVAEIANKLDADGAPVGKAFYAEVPTDADTKSAAHVDFRRIYKQLSDAGDNPAITPAVSVKKSPATPEKAYEQVEKTGKNKGKVLITFWTTGKITRERKPATEVTAVSSAEVAPQ